MCVQFGPVWVSSCGVVRPLVAVLGTDKLYIFLLKHLTDLFAFK